MKKIKSVLIHIGYSRAPFDRNDLDSGQLGGTEYCSIMLAEELSKLGYVVTLHGQVKNSIINKVRYSPFGTIYDSSFDIVIGVAYSHFFRVLDEFRISFKKAYFWLHNESPFDWYKGEYIDTLTNELYDDSRLDGIILLSESHKKHFTETNKGTLSDTVLKKIVLIENGFNSSLIERHKIDKIKNRIIWSSAIDRGLIHILKHWGLLKQNIPDASLTICTPLYSKDFDFESSLFDQPDVYWLGNLSKDKLTEEQQKAEWWIYPGDYFETFCLTHLEMMNHKVKCLTSGSGNLYYLGAENRATIEQNLNPDERMMYFISLIKESQTNKALEYSLIKKVNNAYDWVPRFKWEIKVKDWINLFE